MEFVNALENSYRGIMRGKDLTGARIGGTDKDWVHAEVARNLFTNPNLVGAPKTEVRRNLARNPSLEMNATGWHPYGAGLVYGRSNEKAYIGTHSYRVESETAPIGDWGAQIRNVAGVSPGAVISFSAAVSLETRIGEARIVIEWRDDTGFLSLSSGANATLTQGDWSLLTLDATVPTGATHGYVDVMVMDFGPGDVAFIDALLASPTPGPYFDGNTPDTRMDEYAWTGAENASVSVKLSNAAEVAENLFTNPRLVGDGTWAEVRRNLSPNVLNGLSGGGITGTRASIGLQEGFVRGTITDATPVGLAQRIQPVSLSAAPLVVGGVEYQISAEVRSPNGLDLVLFVAWYNAESQLISQSAVEAGVAGAQFESRSGVLTAPSGAVRAYWQIGVNGVGARSVEDYFDLRRLYVGVPGPYFDGSTTPETAGDVVQPEDFRWRWLGDPNASESVMEIERVAGLVGTNAIPGVSTLDGKPAVRLISTGTGNNTRATFTIPEGAARDGGTWIGTVTSPGTLVSPSNIRLSLYTGNPGSATPAIGSNPDKQGIRHAYSALTEGYNARLVHGGTQGSGDVWWTDIGLFAGNYTGEAFHGSSDPAETGFEQPEDFQVRWTGEVDNSTSVVEIERVRGLTASSCVAGVSTRDGKPAMRLIPTGESPASYAYTTIPVEARSLGTSVGTVTITEPLTGLLSSTRMTTRGHSPSQSSLVPPNEAGSYPVRAVYSDLTSGFTQWFYHGGTQGSGDVWWTDIGLFAGNYIGEAFSGDTLDYGRDTYTWAGERNSSESIKTSWL